MKKLVFALCMFFGAVAVVNAQDTTSTTTPTDPSTTQPSTSPSQASTGMQDEGRVKIKSQELPDAVKSSLESQEYRGWLVNAAYKMDGAANSGTGTSTSGSTSGSTTDTTGVSGNAGTGAYAQEVYIVELKNGAQTKTVRFDKDGKKLDDGGMTDDQK